MARESCESDATTHRADGMDGAYIEFSFEAATEFGMRAQVKVLARADGYEYRRALAATGRDLLGLTQALRQATGRQPGDSVHVALRRDEAPRVAYGLGDPPDALRENDAAASFSAALSATNQKSYAECAVDAEPTPGSDG